MRSRLESLGAQNHLANRLASDLQCGRIETDESSNELLYPERLAEDTRDTPYVDCLDFQDLSERLEAELDRHRMAIVEGICLKDTLARIDQNSDLIVYIKRISRSSALWHDGFHLEDFEEGQRPSRGLHRDVLENHTRTRPHERAEIVLVHGETD